MSRIGTEIARLRKEAGLTQKQLAKQVGVSEKFIDEVETGKRVMNSELITRVSKALRQEAGKLELYDDEEVRQRPEPDKNVKKVIEKPVKEIWTDALAGVIMSVPVYDIRMDKAMGIRQLPIIANKVEGFPKEKVFFLTIENNDMSGFRIMKGDLALAYSTHEFEKEGVYFLEHSEKRLIRQVRKLDQDKLLLVGNSGGLSTETVSRKEIQILARLIRVEIAL
ncbi:MAG TPA: helix-turn-helix domain-containing protein [Clostridia bacterium]|nr:helix-turn-helix domain-containing protein [Clostridia bacterium]